MVNVSIRVVGSGKTATMLKPLFKEYQNTVYITFNKPARDLQEELKGIPLERVFFIDCVTRKAGSTSAANTLFINSPENLTDTSIAMAELLRALPGRKLFIIDSLSAMLFYVDEGMLGRFASYFITKIRSETADAVLLVNARDLDLDVCRRLTAMVDEVKE